MSPEEAGQYERAKDILFTALLRGTDCVIQKADDDVSNNKSPIKSPGPETAPASTVPSVAPVSTVQ